ncbi:MAG: hypothetical protein J6V48_09900 [Clostridia bacterium]|nr:hypothetical protein [Clostridia bacterium]
MKNVKSAVALLLAAFCVVLFTQPVLGIDPPVLTTEIYGQPVLLNSPHNHSFSALSILNDFTSDEIDDLNDYWDDKFVKPQYPYTHRLDTATAKYNCHSYAWINQSTNNSYWYNMPNDSDYFNCVTSYIPVSGSITVGDILLYVEDIDDDNYIIRHSAVVVSTDGTASNTILVSKWGPAGLYKHKIYTGHPYTSYGIFYYHVSATHNLSYTDTGSVTSHLVSCSCGKTFSDPHNYQSAYGGTAVICSYCGHLEYIRSANSVIKEEQ